jgi:hypothetical protein
MDSKNVASKNPSVWDLNYPGFRHLNTWRNTCFDVNYSNKALHDYENTPQDYSAAKAFGTNLAFKTLTIITIPSNTLSTLISITGTVGSIIFTAMVLMYFLMTGKGEETPTGFVCNRNALYSSILNILCCVYQFLYEYIYRIASCYGEVLNPREKIPEVKEGADNSWKTFPISQFLNDIKTKYEKEKGAAPYFINRTMTILTFPANSVDFVITLIYTPIAFTFLIVKAALYILLGLKIKTTTGFQRSFQVLTASFYHILKNILEFGNDICVYTAKKINKWRKECFKVNYNYDYDYFVPEGNWSYGRSIAANIGHKALVLISIPINLLEFISTFIICPTLYLPFVIAALISGNENNFEFGGACSKSICQIFRTIFYEIPFEYTYRICNSYDNVLNPDDGDSERIEKKHFPSKKVPNLRALPGTHFLNVQRITFRKAIRRQGEKDNVTRSYLLHKLISIINVPLNIISIPITAIFMAVSLVFIIAKTAIYVLTGLRITMSTGLEKSFEAFKASAYHLYRNFAEFGMDFIIIPGVLSHLFGNKEAGKRVKAFLKNAREIFISILYAEKIEKIIV